MTNICRRVLHWLRDQIVQDVPEELEFCEFHCRQPQCAGRKDACMCGVSLQETQNNCSDTAEASVSGAEDNLLRT